VEPRESDFFGCDVICNRIESIRFDEKKLFWKMIKIVVVVAMLCLFGAAAQAGELNVLGEDDFKPFVAQNPGM
jgi:hypothetical protein